MRSRTSQTAIGRTAAPIPIAFLCFQHVKATPGAGTGAVPAMTPQQREAGRAEPRSMPEQLGDAYARHVLDLPLGHSTDEAEPPNFGLANVPQNEVEIDDNTPRAEHISIWVTSPYYEDEEFPMTEVRLSQAVTDQSPHFPDWLSTAIPTWPQIAEAHASYIRIPPWLLLTDTYVLVIDTGSATNRVFSCFHQGPVTKRAILRHADVHASEPYEVFTFGDLNPLQEGEQRLPRQGGLVNLLRRGEVVEWNPVCHSSLGGAGPPQGRPADLGSGYSGCTWNMRSLTQCPSSTLCSPRFVRITLS